MNRGHKQADYVLTALTEGNELQYICYTYTTESNNLKKADVDDR